MRLPGRGRPRCAGLPLPPPLAAGGGKATGRPQRAGRRTRGKASRMLAHPEGFQTKGGQSCEPGRRGGLPALFILMCRRLWRRPFGQPGAGLIVKDRRATALDTMTSVKTGKWAGNEPKRPPRWGGRVSIREKFKEKSNDKQRHKVTLLICKEK